MGTLRIFDRRCPRRARPRDFAFPGVSKRLPASRPASLAASLSLGLLTSGASDIALARNLASSSLAEAQAAVPHGPHQARLPHRCRLNPRPNAPFLPPFGAVATEFSFMSGFYSILYFFSSPPVVRRSFITRGGYSARHSASNNSVNSGGGRNL